MSKIAASRKVSRKKVVKKIISTCYHTKLIIKESFLKTSTDDILQKLNSFSSISSIFLIKFPDL